MEKSASQDDDEDTPNASVHHKSIPAGVPIRLTLPPSAPLSPEEETCNPFIYQGSHEKSSRRWRLISNFRNITREKVEAVYTVALALFLLLALGAVSSGIESSMCSGLFSPEVGGVRPTGFPIVARVWVTEQETLSILDCYLKRNSAAAGGWVDIFEFVEGDDVKESTSRYLRDVLIPSSDSYKLLPRKKGISAAERAIDDLENNVMYLKIDGNIVYIADEAIPRLIQASLSNALFQFRVPVFGANVVGMTRQAWRARKDGAFRAFLPSEAKNGTTDWRMDGRMAEKPTQDSAGVWSWDTPESLEPVEGTGARTWGALAQAHEDVRNTPLGAIRGDDVFGNCSWDSALCAIQEHYSFLANLQDSDDANVPVYMLSPLLKAYGTCPAFLYGPGEVVPVHFGTFWRRGLWGVEIDDRDGATLMKTKTPSRIGIVGKAMVSWYGYAGQVPGLDMSDVRLRYQLLAEEKCGLPNYMTGYKNYT